MLFPCLYRSLIHQVSDILSISCIIYTYMFFSPSLFPGYINCLLNHTHTHNIGYFRVSSFFLSCLQCRIILYCLKMLTISCSTMGIINIVIMYHNILITTYLSNTTSNVKFSEMISFCILFIS